MSGGLTRFLRAKYKEDLLFYDSVPKIFSQLAQISLPSFSVRRNTLSPMQITSEPPPLSSPAPRGGGKR
jgi:hypothetical protein